MMKGLDISYYNDLSEKDFRAIKDAGYQFVIIRLGFGTHTLDEKFMSHYNNAKNVGLRISIYHFSEACDIETARVEGRWVRKTLEELGVGCERIWLDMEESNWKSKNNFRMEKGFITDLCRAFFEELEGLNVGLYASLNWLNNYIDWRALGCPVWSAQYNTRDDFRGSIWQYTDRETVPGIPGKRFDANISYQDLI